MTRRRHPARGATPTSTMRIARRGDAVAASAAAPAALRRGALFLATAAAGVLALGACRDGGRVVRDESQAPGRGAAERTSRAGEVEPAGSAPGTAMRPGQASPATFGGAGSGLAAPSTDWTGSIGTPGSGRLETGDPNDAQVRGLLAAVNRGELEVSQLGQGKARDANVRQYATTLVQSHQRALQRIGEGTATGTGDLSTPMIEAARRTQLRLQALPAGPDFDRTFMTQQVALHEGALQVLGRMEQSARDGALVNEIRAMRDEVHAHLEQALRLQNAVSRPPAGTSDPGLSAPALGFYNVEATGAGASRAGTPAPNASGPPNAPGGATRSGGAPTSPRGA